jgi:hypothetical protein
MIMLKAIPKDKSLSTYQILEGETPVAEIDLSWWRERGKVSVEGKNYQAYRDGQTNGAFVLDLAGAIVARAEKAGLFRSSFNIECCGRQYNFRRPSLFESSFTLWNGALQVGWLRKESLFSRRTEADLPNDLPLTVRVFIIWMTIILRENQAESWGWAFGAGH